jgi:hypothetical protein
MKTFKITVLLAIIPFIHACSNSNKGSIKAAEKAKNKSVVITFLDSATQVVEDLKFQYEWMYEDDKRYLNPPHYNTESNDFHYSKTIHGVEIDKIFFRDSIARIKFQWPIDLKDGDYRSPDLIIIIFKSGIVQKINIADYSVGSTFLLGATKKDSAVIQLNKINFIGFGNIDGQRGKFTSQVSLHGSLKIKRSECVSEIAF